MRYDEETDQFIDDGIGPDLYCISPGYEKPKESEAKQRVRQEKEELYYKLQKLWNFINENNAYWALSKKAQDLLEIQYNIMSAYDNILEMRLENWED